MNRVRSALAPALVFHLLILPLVSAPAAAQGEAGRGDRGAGTLRPRGASEFRAGGVASRLEGARGFRAETLPGTFRHHGHAHPGGLAKFEAPWGELMTIRYWTSPSGTVAIEYDGELTVRYRFDDAGQLAAITAETGERSAHTELGDRSRQLLWGETDLASFDMAAYELIDDVFRSSHSQAFLDGVAGFEALAEAGCGTSAVQCGVCIVAWAASVAAIGAACLVGGVPTWGLSCLAAIVAHEASSVGCAVTCINAFQECGWADKGDVVDDGCSGPGDAE